MKYIYFRKTLIIIIGLTLFTNIYGQNKRTLTIKEAVLSVDDISKKSLSPQNLNYLQWMPGNVHLSYIALTGANSTLVRTSAVAEDTDTLIRLNDLNSAYSNLKNGTSKKLTSFPMVHWIDDFRFWLQADSSYYKYSLKAGIIEIMAVLPSDISNTEYHEKSNRFAYTRNGNVFIWNSGETIQITNDAVKGIVYGESVHRNEFGIYKGFFWSKEGNHLAFYRMDERMVTDYSIYNLASNPAGTNTIKYPTAGSPSHHVTIGVYDILGKKLKYLKTGEPAEKYLTNVEWSPDAGKIYVAEVNREQNHMQLNQYLSATGEFEKTLFEEKNPKYVEPENPVLFVPNRTNCFVWQSERDGYNHLYMYQDNGKLLKQLTNGNWVVTRILGINEQGTLLYFESTKESPLERHIYTVDLENYEMRKISAAAGTHSGLLNSKGNLLVDNFNSQIVPRQISVLDQMAVVKRILLTAADPLSGFQMGETQILPLVNNDVILYYRIITPPDFDKKKKYPVINYVYGGPHVQLITNSWLGGSNLWMQYMAQLGYVVFTLDGRGSANRGFEFESAVHRQLGTIEMADQLAGIQQLSKLSYINTEKMAVHGWSFGGFMTTSLMTRSPGTFKVGVAGGPVIDWRLYEIMYTERYMDSPNENPVGYEQSNLLLHVSNLKNKLLMIHGCDDDVVLWQHSLQYCKAAVDAGNTYLDYFVYPGHKHNVRGKDRVHLMDKITRYILDNL